MKKPRETPDEIDLEALYGLPEPDPADLWFLADEPARPADDRPPLDRDMGQLREELERAQAETAAALAHTSQLLGELDARLKHAPRGERQTLRWRRRLVALELEALAWHIDPSIRREQIVLHTRFARAGPKTEELARAFETLRWAHGRMLAPAPPPVTRADYLRFLGWTGRNPDEETQAFLQEMEERLWRSFRLRPEALDQLGAFQAAARDLHPLVAACGVLVAWRALGFDEAVLSANAHVLAARTAAESCRGGLLAVPLLGPTRLSLPRGLAPARTLGPFLEAAQNAIYRSLLEIDRTQAWEEVVRGAPELRGRGVMPGLVALLAEEPLVSAEMAARVVGASHQGVLNGLARLEGRGLVREVTGYRRYRCWTATLPGQGG